MNKAYEQLVRICKVNFNERQKALFNEIKMSGRKPLVLKDGTIVLPSDTEHHIALVAHYDNVPDSYGYNDNGMSIVAILGILDRLPNNVEVVFTNGEETGFTGAMEYIRSRGKQVSHCINLDVCGYGDTVYLDKMNSTFADGVDAVTGNMPCNDGMVFQEYGIESVCLSTSKGSNFHKGIHDIWQTIHNNTFDNRLDILNFELVPKVQNTVEKLIGAINSSSKQTVVSTIHHIGQAGN